MSFAKERSTIEWDIVAKKCKKSDAQEGKQGMKILWRPYGQPICKTHWKYLKFKIFKKK